MRLGVSLYKDYSSVRYHFPERLWPLSRLIKVVRIAQRCNRAFPDCECKVMKTLRNVSA